MKVRKGLKATIIAMAAFTGSNASEEAQAMRAAMGDIAQEYGHKAIIIDINSPSGDLWPKESGNQGKNQSLRNQGTKENPKFLSSLEKNGGQDYDSKGRIDMAREPDYHD